MISGCSPVAHSIHQTRAIQKALREPQTHWQRPTSATCTRSCPLTRPSQCVQSIISHSLPLEAGNYYDCHHFVYSTATSWRTEVVTLVHRGRQRSALGHIGHGCSTCKARPPAMNPLSEADRLSEIASVGTTIFVAARRVMNGQRQRFSMKTAKSVSIPLRSPPTSACGSTLKKPRHIPSSPCKGAESTRE